jgi:hypothetical protein
MDQAMNNEITRREFVGVTATAALAGSLASTAAAAEGEFKPIKILGIACSPRKGMTTAKAVQAALDAAKGLDARIQVELIDLGRLNIAGYSPTPTTGRFRFHPAETPRPGSGRDHNRFAVLFPGTEFALQSVH